MSTRHPGRVPPILVLRDLAGENLARLKRDADQALTAFIYQAVDRDVGFAFTRAAAHGGLACRHWWGHPVWPRLVARWSPWTIPAVITGAGMAN